MSLITYQEFTYNCKLLEPYIYTNGILTITPEKFHLNDPIDIKNILNNKIAFQIWINCELSHAIVNKNFNRISQLLPFWNKGLIYICNRHPVIHQVIEQTSETTQNNFIINKQIFETIINYKFSKKLINNTKYLDKYGLTPFERMQTYNNSWQENIMNKSLLR